MQKSLSHAANKISLNLSIRPYYPSLSVGFRNCTLYQCRAVAGKFLINTGMSMREGPQETVIYTFIPISPAVPRMFCLSYLNGIRERR